MTHSVQYRKLGFGSFLNRYLGIDTFGYGRELDRPHSYEVPPDLDNKSINDIDPVDKAFGLDQIAMRVEFEVYRRWGAP
jgi:hypothetical protein